MNQANTILMIVLCTMIGFGIGNAWGKETMKRTFSEVMEQLMNGVKNYTDANKQKTEE